MDIDYYKSLISDEEVIKALIKESKAREGELLKEKTRVRPNLNFFQRTVTNLVTSNKRVVPTKELLYKESEKSICKIRGGKIKTPHRLVKEIVTANKINSVKVKDNTSTTVKNDLDKQFVNPITKTKSGQSIERSNSVNTSPVEESYKEDLSKYFVGATDKHITDRKITKSKNSVKRCIKNTSKSKNIVFNLNFNKSRLEKCAAVSEKLVRSERPNLSISESPDNDVISISSSPSSSSESDVIRISETESD